MRRLPLVLLGLLFFVTMSCDKKDSPEPEEEKWDSSPEAYLKDTTLYYTKLLSLWQESILPANINDIVDSVKVRNITKNHQTAEELLDYLIAMTPRDPATNRPYDRFSFLDRENVVSEEIQNARSTSYGMYVIYLQTAESVQNNNNADLYVRMVDLNSSAYQAGIRRGDRILSIDGNTKYDYNTQQAQGFKGINDALNSQSMTIKWRKPDGGEVEKKITQSEYNVNPILKSWVADLEGQKVGYFALSSFINIVNNQGQPTSMFTSLQTLFNTYQTQGVKHLIVDLRYNGGGATLTAEYLANRIAPASTDGKRMYYYKVNPFLQQELADDFQPTNFSKIGTLELTKVYFLVTSSTASASELLINSLKPYMDVQVIGSENTYGKPVGFWGIPIGKKPAKGEIYVTSFQMFNASNFGDYFNGLTPNKLSREDFLKDFGDPSEGFIAEALYHIKNGSYSSGTRSAIAAKDISRVNSTHKVKTVNTRISDMGMFKFGNESIKLK